MKVDIQARSKQEYIKRTVRHFKELHKSLSDLKKREKAYEIRFNQRASCHLVDHLAI